LLKFKNGGISNENGAFKVIKITDHIKFTKLFVKQLKGNIKIIDELNSIFKVIFRDI